MGILLSKLSNDIDMYKNKPNQFLFGLFVFSINLYTLVKFEYKFMLMI